MVDVYIDKCEDTLHARCGEVGCQLTDNVKDVVYFTLW